MRALNNQQSSRTTKAIKADEKKKAIRSSKTDEKFQFLNFVKKQIQRKEKQLKQLEYQSKNF